MSYLSRLAPSVTLVVMCVSRAFCSKDQFLVKLVINQPCMKPILKPSPPTVNFTALKPRYCIANEWIANIESFDLRKFFCLRKFILSSILPSFSNVIDRHIPEFRDTYNSFRSLSFGMNLTQFCAKPRKLYSSKWSFSVHAPDARTIASTLSLENHNFFKKCVQIYYMVLAPV